LSSIMHAKSLFVTFAVVILLTLSTFSVAHWSDKVEIQGKVEVASNTIGFSEIISCGDNEDTIVEPKDVGSITCALDVLKTDVHTGKTAYKKLSIALINVYPCYEAWCEVTIENIGTLPAILKAVSFSDPTGVLTYDPEKQCFIDSDYNEILEVRVDPDPVGQTIDPCDAIGIKIIIHAKQAALESYTYIFEVEIIDPSVEGELTYTPDPNPDPNPETTNTAPHIEEDTFSMEMYSGGQRCLRPEASVPYTFSGETVEFEVNASDADGVADIAFDGAVEVVLSSDDVIDQDDMYVGLAPSAAVNGTTYSFEGEWNATGDYGLFKIFITAIDDGLTPADNWGVNVGEIFLNPRVVESVSTSSLTFGIRGIGETNVSATPNSMIVTNIDPDNVGMKVDILMYGSDLEHASRDATISVSNIRVEGGLCGIVSLSAAPQKIDTLSSGASGTYNFYLDIPPAVPSGDYSGTITVLSVENSFD